MLVLAASAHAQTHAEAGHPFVTVYEWTDYDASPDTWTAAQDQRGVMYFGSTGGVLEYDGASWRLIPLPSRSTVLALATDDEGRVWVGGYDDFGTLAPDDKGRMHFVSLSDHVPETHRGFGLVRRAVTTPEGVYFLTDHTLFRWDGHSVQAWPLPSESVAAAAIGGTVYVTLYDRGLLRVEGDALRPVPSGERFAETSIHVILPFGDGRLLLGTRGEGLVLYDPTPTQTDARFTVLTTEADALLAEGLVHAPGAVLPGGRFALGTRAAGLVVIDRAGRLLSHVDTEAGLPDDQVSYVYLDRDGDLWLSHRRGTSHVKIDAPFTTFDAQSGLASEVYGVARYKRLIYAGTADGLHRLDPASGTFQKIEGPTGFTYNLIATDDGLFAFSNGVWRLNSDRAELVLPASTGRINVETLQPLNGSPGRWLVAHDAGLDLFRWTGERFVLDRPVPGIESGIGSIHQDAAGVVWLKTYQDEVIRVQPTGRDDPFEETVVTTYGEADGVPTVFFSLFAAGRNLFAATSGGDILLFDSAASRFVPDHRFEAARSGHPLTNTYVREAPSGDLWFAPSFGSPVRMTPIGEGQYSVVPSSLNLLRDVMVDDVYVEESGVAWLMGLEQLVRYDPKAERAVAVAPAPFFRRVAAGDSVFYAGAGARLPIEVPPDAVTVHFAYAAGHYDPMRYRTRLDGLENDWTAWDSATEREFTGLGPGHYSFLVQAQDMSGDPGPEATYAFVILPPLWRTWWAYLGYALVALGVMAAAYRARRRRHELRHRAEMEHVEAESLRALDRAKSQFFANVSHEFRTPLTLTLGPLDDVLAGEYGPVSEEVMAPLGLAQRSAGRVLSLINQILAVSKLEAGSIPLRARRLDLAAFAEAQIEAFVSLAVRRRITVNVEHPDVPVEVWADPEHAGTILVNLLSNAFKFTPEEGAICVTVGSARQRGPASGSGQRAGDCGGRSETHLRPVLSGRRRRGPTARIRDRARACARADHAPRRDARRPK